jgi:hypothetical protein
MRNYENEVNTKISETQPTIAHSVSGRIALVACLCGVAVFFGGKACGLKLVRVKHESPNGYWGKSLELVNQGKEPLLELVYWAWNKDVGLAWFRDGRSHWLGLGTYPGAEPRE